MADGATCLGRDADPPPWKRKSRRPQGHRKLRKRMMHKIKNANEIDPKAQPIDRVAARVVYGEAVHFNEKRRQELKIEEGGATWR